MVEMVRNSTMEIERPPQHRNWPAGGRPQITPLLRGLAVGQSEKFPIEQAASVRAIVSKLKVEKSREGWKCRIDVNSKTFQVTVTRVR